MNKIKFSVLMSVYKNDRATDVKLAIDSVLKQTLKPNQFVIMVDGKISKELEKLLDEYDLNQAVIEIHKRDNNLGLGLTLNEGLTYCKYEYVARMDADDYCYPMRFERQVSYIESHPEIDIIGCNIEEYDQCLKEKLALRIVPETDSAIKFYMKKRNGFNHVTVLFRKSVVLDAGSYEDCPYFEDYYLWCKLMKQGCLFYNLQEPLMKVRAGDDYAKRRGGLSYSRHIINFERKIKDMGIINSFDYLNNLIIRLTVANFPNCFRSFLYKKQLRGNKQ